MNTINVIVYAQQFSIVDAQWWQRKQKQDYKSNKNFCYKTNRTINACQLYSIHIPTIKAIKLQIIINSISFVGSCFFALYALLYRDCDCHWNVDCKNVYVWYTWKDVWSSSHSILALTYAGTFQSRYSLCSDLCEQIENGWRKWNMHQINLYTHTHIRV